MADANEVLEGLERALAEAGSVPLSCLSRAELGAWVCRLQGLRARMDALASAGTAEAHQASVHAGSGQRTVHAYVASRTSADPKVVAADRNTGAWLAEFPLFAEAAGAGVLTRRHIQVLREATNARTRASLAEAQHYLVDAARACGWAEFVRVLRYWVLAADPDGQEPNEQIASRSTSIRKTSDGCVRGTFRLDPVAGDAFATALQREEQHLFRHDARTGNNRSASQRRADALTNLVTRGAATGATPAAPLLHILMSQRVADDILARLHHEPELHTGHVPLRLDPDDIDRRCELADGTPIHPRLAAGALAAATLRRLVLQAPSESLDLGAARCFPPHLKQALLAAARGRCQARGCDAPYAWLQADHIEPHSSGGATATGNGQILCDPHNKAKRDRSPPGHD